ncbi:MAG: protein kinase [Ardenticatenia bacterium]|nr:protein kinase [Ardenticatenia bacterium]
METPVVLDRRYRLTERIGEGGMAEVYRGIDLRLGREVAVKVLRPQYAGDQKFLERFLQEARAMASFSHPNIVNVYDVGREGRRYYIVMEYVPGTDLRRFLQQRGQLPVREALEIARQIAAGVGAAHRKGIVHRDIKPGNVLITPTGEAKVADFGIARAMTATHHLTEPGVVWGTTAYLSPEQIRGEAATPASDVYAIGVVLFEMLAGRPPFQGEDHVAIALQHLNESPPRLSQLNPRVPPSVERLVERMLSKDPAQRFATADDVASVIFHLLHASTDATAAVPALSSTPVAPPTPSDTPPAASPPPSTFMRRRSRHTPGQVAGAGPSAARSRKQRGRPVAAARPATISPGIDWVGIVLGMLALLALLGLIPLYALVYQRIAGSVGSVIHPVVFLMLSALL